MSYRKNHNQNNLSPILIFFISVILGGTAVYAIAEDHEFIVVLVIIAILAFIIYKRFNHNDKNNNVTQQVKPASQEMNAHYRAAGLSDEEIKFFRDTMATAETQISQLQTSMKKTPKLQAVELRDEPVKVSKAIFKELVKEPQKLHTASDYLYRHLPTMLDITNKYNEISNHQVKDKDTYDVLAKSISVIEELSQQIKADYQKLVSDDFSDMEVDMSMAKDSMPKQNDSSSTDAPTIAQKTDIQELEKKLNEFKGDQDK